MLLRALTKTGRWLIYLLVGLLLLMALLISMARFAVLQDGDHSERLASLVSRYVGSPVEIDKVDLVWERFDAVASLSDVRVLAPDGAGTDLILPSIELELNLRDMLLERNLSIRKVQLKQLSLLAEYKGNGELEILGREIRPRRNTSLEATAAEGAEPSRPRRSALTWLFNAERIAILDSGITLTDQTRDTTYQIDNVDIRAFNDGDLHQIRISSSLPDVIGNTSVASFDFTGSADNIRDWSGQFYIDTKQLNLGEISDLIEGVAVEGTADLQAWGRWQGTRINEVRLIGSATAVDLQPLNSDTADAVSAAQIDVDLDWKRGEQGWQSTFNQLAVQFGATIEERITLDGLDFSETRDQYGQRQYWMAGPDIDLFAARPLISFLSAHSGAGDAAVGIRSGTVSDWQLVATFEDKALSLKSATGRLNDIAVDTPMFTTETLNANIQFQEKAGRIELLPESMLSGTDALFDNNMPPVSVAGVLHFADSNQRWLFGSDNLTLTNGDIKTRTRFNLRLNRFQQKLIDAVTSIEYINLANASRYVPHKVLKPRLSNWLRDAIVNGNVVRGRVTVSGDLTDYAPAAGRGELFGEMDFVDSTLKFRPDWPVARQMDGNLTFNANSMRGRVYQGAMREARFSDARMLIADFKTPTLELQTNAIGPLDDLLDFAQRGPLAGKIGRFFGDAKGVGASRLELDLTLPLKRELRDRLDFDGVVRLESAQIDAKQFGLDLESVTGKVRFNRGGVLIDDLLVRYLGIPVKVNATQKQISGKFVNSVRVDGPIAISSVLGAYGIPLTDSFEGVSNWQVALDITRTAPGARPTVELNASSDQSGTAVELPVPFYKAADTIREVSVYRNFTADDKDWWVDLPGLAQLRIRIGDDRKLESMAVALGRSNNTVLPWRGVAVHGDVGRIDTLGWFQFVGSLRSADSSAGKAPFPLFAKVAARDMKIGQQSVGNGVYIAFRDGESQVHRLESPWVSGEARVKFNAAPLDPVVLRLDQLDKRLLLAFGESKASDNMTNRPFDPRQLPPVDVIVKELKWDNWRLLRVAMRTKPGESGVDITSLTARQESIRISGSGQWRVSSAGAHSTNLDINASVDNVGAGFRALGGGESFAEGAGETALSLSWPGPAYAPDLKAMTGTLFMNLRNGRVLGVEPGAGRVLGLFALQALPRRLALDFRDIVNTGLEYTSINGNFTIAEGKLASQTLLVTGPVAEILIHGYSDFSERTYNQTIDVLPRVSGALPLIGVLSGGPAAGVTALVADGILKGLGVNLDEIGRRRFTLTGSWEQPVWQTVEMQASR
jgi:uncharacterized protein (TIGR02099 family)